MSLRVKRKKLGKKTCNIFKMTVFFFLKKLWICVCVCVCAWMCVYSPEDNLWCLPQTCCPPPLRHSLPLLGALQLQYTGQPTSPGCLPPLFPGHWDYKACPAMTMAGISTWMLKSK